MMKDIVESIKMLPLEHLYKLNSFIVGIIELKLSERNVDISNKFPVNSIAEFVDSKKHLLHYIVITNVSFSKATGKEFTITGQWSPVRWTVPLSMLQESKAARPTEPMPEFSKKRKRR